MPETENGSGVLAPGSTGASQGQARCGGPHCLMSIKETKEESMKETKKSIKETYLWWTALLSADAVGAKFSMWSFTLLWTGVWCVLNCFLP